LGAYKRYKPRKKGIKKMERYNYKFTTNKGSEVITVKGKGIKRAIKEFNAPFLTVEYINKNNKRIVKG
jgi:hypothetical protein